MQLQAVSSANFAKLVDELDRQNASAAEIVRVLDADKPGHWHPFVTIVCDDYALELFQVESSVRKVFDLLRVNSSNLERVHKSSIRAGLKP